MNPFDLPPGVEPTTEPLGWRCPECQSAFALSDPTELARIPHEALADIFQSSATMHLASGCDR